MDCLNEILEKEKEISKEELKELAPFCSCSRCDTAKQPFPYNLGAFFTCACCVGCLNTDEIVNIQSYIIEKARELRDLAQGKKAKISSFSTDLAQ